MPVLAELLAALHAASIEVIDLTAPLHSGTPILQLPPPFANTAPFALTEISRYDERGPAWYWNDIITCEHTGTHFDVPVHWITGRDGEDIAQVPVERLIAPAVVLDLSAESAGDPDFLLEIEHVRAWEAEHGPLPEGGWLLYRTGWDARGEDAERSSTAASPRASPSRVRSGWRRSRRSSDWASRPSVPTPAAHTGSTRRSRATRSCSAPASTG